MSKGLNGTKLVAWYDEQISGLKSDIEEAMKHIGTLLNAQQLERFEILMLACHKKLSDLMVARQIQITSDESEMEKKMQGLDQGPSPEIEELWRSHRLAVHEQWHPITNSNPLLRKALQRKR